MLVVGSGDVALHCSFVGAAVTHSLQTLTPTTPPFAIPLTYPHPMLIYDSDTTSLERLTRKTAQSDL